MHQPRWATHVRVIGSFALAFAGVAAVGIFLSAAGASTAGAGTGVEAMAAAASAVLCLAAAVTLFRANLHRRGGLLGPRPKAHHTLSYRTHVRRS
jgi:hypothetical protein